ncbi:MAG: hypothetical protein KKC79_09690, partial [Gammaproteobacteria bacterium]|nr:hypothetical protein [Gammaproteobacteria bacterium]
VAGRLRSFNYARWRSLRRVAQNADEVDRLEPAVRALEGVVRDAFLDAYRQTIAASEKGSGVDAQLLKLFEIEKALYELRYELNNRVDWAQVPLQGILALINAGAAR